MKLQYEIKLENLKNIEIKQITLNKDKFGALTFDKAYPLLHNLRKMLVEFDELGYQELLNRDEINDIENFKKRLLDYVAKINNLNPETDATFNKNVRDNLENEIDNFYRSTIKTLRNNLVYLRQESALKSQDKQSLAEEQKAATSARRQAEEIITQLKQKLDELNKREQQLESTAGKVGSKALGIHFDDETRQYQKRADKWFTGAIVMYVFLAIFIIGTAIYYTFLKENGWSNLSWQEGSAKLFLFATFWYGLSFIIRNYNVSSHLAAVNRHRAAVARTLEDFLAANPPHTGEMLQNGTDSMFKHAAVGFITKAEKDSGNPLLEIINKVVSPKSE